MQWNLRLAAAQRGELARARSADELRKSVQVDPA